ncbi:MAG: hypothetical protein HFF80_04095 [Oscillospiraceae bacterium]|jgi:hypothetical protein|nr:hypothetical protein [Oscillospiraceae bacterium]
MKWQNRGHEFDGLGAYFQEHADIYIYTDEGYAHTLAAALTFLKREIRLIDPSVNQAEGSRVPLREVLGRPEGKLVLIPIGYPDPDGIRRTLEDGGYQWNRNLFWSPDFMDRFLPVYALYVADILYFPSLSFLSTTVCNLNCEKCLIFKPYAKTMRHRELGELEREVDQVFSCVDYIGLIHVSGGEPFLYPHLAELLAYIDGNYRDQIGTLGTVTNCSVIPDEKLCRALLDHRIFVELDDYTAAVPSLAEPLQKIRETMETHQISFKINHPVTWIDAFPPRQPYQLLGDEELMERFRRCANPFMELRNGRLYSCNYMGYAVTAGLIPDCLEDVYCLDGFSPVREKRRELLEFRMKFNQRGYVEFCKYCNGFPGINPAVVVPAEQAAGLLHWDMPQDRPMEE